MTNILRKDFPLLGNVSIAYLDNAATAQRPQCVIDAEAEFYRKHNAEPHRAAQHPRLPASVGPAGGTGRVVFGGIGENAQLIHQNHMPASSDMVFSV